MGPPKLLGLGGSGNRWGVVPAEQIVGFMHLDQYKPDGPIFIRRSFRKSEPEAFEYMFNVMSGMTP
jgi:hypothetical protein